MLVVVVLLVFGEIIIGLLGFIKFGDWKWYEVEFNVFMIIVIFFV